MFRINRQHLQYSVVSGKLEDRTLSCFPGAANHGRSKKKNLKQTTNKTNETVATTILNATHVTGPICINDSYELCKQNTRGRRRECVKSVWSKRLDIALTV